MNSAPLLINLGKAAKAGRCVSVSPTGAQGPVRAEGLSPESYLFFETSESRIESPTEGPVAVINVTDAISFRGYGGWWAIDAERFADRVGDLVANQNVTDIVFDTTCPGGAYWAMNPMVTAVDAAKEAGKRVHMLVNGMACSLAMALAFACDRVVAVPGSEVGSIGTIAFVEDTRGQAEQHGIKMVGVTTASHKLLNAWGVEQQPEWIDAYREQITQMNAEFVALAARRGITEQQITEWDGRCFTGQAAIDAGLVDAVMSADAFYESLFQGPDANQSRRTGAGATNGVQTMASQQQLRSAAGKAGNGVAPKATTVDDLEEQIKTLGDDEKDELMKRLETEEEEPESEGDTGGSADEDDDALDAKALKARIGDALPEAAVNALIVDAVTNGWSMEKAMTQALSRAGALLKARGVDAPAGDPGGAAKAGGAKDGPDGAGQAALELRSKGLNAAPGAEPHRFVTESRALAAREGIDVVAAMERVKREHPGLHADYANGSLVR